MTVYKYFIKIALRNKWAILSYTIVFFVLSIINGSNPTRGETSFVEAKLDIGIIDNSNSQLSNSLKDYLGDKNHIVDVGQDEESIKEQIFLEAADAIIV